MRITRPLTYETMLQIASKGGCVICAVLKDQQSASLEHPNLDDGSQLCNYHGWALAAASNGKEAAEIFLRLLKRTGKRNGEAGCQLCRHILQEEEDKLRDLSHIVHDPEVLIWLEQNSALCFRHAQKLAVMAGTAREARITKIAECAGERLRTSLQTFVSGNAQGANSGGGSLGRAAEFLFGYRGLPRS